MLNFDVELLQKLVVLLQLSQNTNFKDVTRERVGGKQFSAKIHCVVGSKEHNVHKRKKAKCSLERNNSNFNIFFI